MLHNVSVYLTLDKFIKLRYFTINLANVGERQQERTRYTVLEDPKEESKIFPTLRLRVQRGKPKARAEGEAFY